MIEILKYKSIERAGALVGRFDVKMHKWGGFIIRECSHFKKGEASWMAFPNRTYEEDGVKKFYAFNLFDTPEMTKVFTEKVMAALKDYLSTNREAMDVQSELQLRNPSQDHQSFQ